MKIESSIIPFDVRGQFSKNPRIISIKNKITGDYK